MATCPDGPAQQALVQRSQNKGLVYEDRVEAYQAGLKACPEALSLYQGLTALLLEHGDTKAALDWSQRGLQKKPDDAVLSLDFAVALLSAGQSQRALEVLSGLPSTRAVQFSLGMAQRALGNHAAARQAFSQSIALGNEDPYTFYELVEQDYALHDRKQGLQDFQAFYERWPDSPWLHMLYGNAYLSKQQDAQAEGEFQQALQQNPELPVAHFYLGYLAFQRSDYGAAAANLAAEIRRDPSFGDSYLYLGASLRRQGKNHESLPYLREAIVRDPDTRLAYHEMATALMAEQQDKEALGVLRIGEQKFPSDAAFPAQLARLLQRLGALKEAEQQASKAKSLLGSTEANQRAK